MDDQLTAARVRLVQLYQAHPQGWPDGIDTKYDRWYTTNKAYWDRLAVTKTVTKTPEIVTEISPPVTEIQGVTKTADAVVLRLKQVGRPKKDKTVSAAERARRYRASKKP